MSESRSTASTTKWWPYSRVASKQVKRAAFYKQDDAAVRAPERRNRMMDRLRTRAVEHGIDPDVVVRVYNAMIEATVIDVRNRAPGVEGSRSHGPVLVGMCAGISGRL